MILELHQILMKFKAAIHHLESEIKSGRPNPDHLDGIARTELIPLAHYLKDLAYDMKRGGLI